MSAARPLAIFIVISFCVQWRYRAKTLHCSCDSRVSPAVRPKRKLFGGCSRCEEWENYFREGLWLCRPRASYSEYCHNTVPHCFHVDAVHGGRRFTACGHRLNEAG